MFSTGKKSGSYKSEDVHKDGADDEEDISIRFDIAALKYLSCPSCSKPLKGDIFQCFTGHLICNSCSHNDRYCPSCMSKADYRCVTVERLIEAIKVPCPYAKYGCKAMLPYAKSLDHQGSCIFHSMCFCPILSCSFSGSSQQISKHFVEFHESHLIKLKYNVSAPVPFDSSDPFYLLEGPEGELFLLLIHDRDDLRSTGNAFSIVCISSRSWMKAFEYEITVVGLKKISLHLKASMTYVRRWMGAYPTDAVLLVPRDFGYISSFKVLIRKKA